MDLDKSIFKSYDIRGVYPKQLNEGITRLIAQAYLKILSQKLKKKVSDLYLAIGQDIRESSKSLNQALIDTFLDYGVKIDNLGLISINDIYFAVGYYEYDGGIVTTASHNPPQYGGFKMVMTNQDIPDSIDFISGESLYQQLSNLPLTVEKLKGSIKDKDISQDHLRHILSFADINKIKPLKVVVDTGNGMMGLLIPHLFEKLPCQLIPLFLELDKNFLNRSPNPLVEGATIKVSQKVIKEKADLGVIFDVDGDRMFLIDEQGNLVKGDMVLLLLAKSMLKKQPGSGIVYNLICSHAVPELITKWGGQPIRSEVGYRNLADHMRKEDGLMSGEVSAHFAFKDNYYADSGFIALVLALAAISQDGRKLSEIIKDFSLYSRGDEINIEVDDIQAALDKIRTSFSANIKDEIDGITVEFSDWWFNVRPSNTEPLLRITVEAKNQKELQKHQQEILTSLNH
ncbi:phosphomannomutase/phosphoglucomutase [Patescibacteria group bacterium]|nr:phosphomannomutase/phosphoglucomutase [Patescibacteria group bacterium]